MTLQKTLNRLRPGDLADLLTRPGSYHDGGGLWLIVRQTGDHAPRGNWLYQRRVGGKIVNRGLGPVGNVSLAQARKLRNDMASAAIMVPRARVAAPQASTAMAASVAISGRTFGQIVGEFIDAKSSKWKGDTEANQFRRLTALDLGKIDIATVDTPHVLAALDHWKDKLDTAERMRNRIEQVLSYAGAMAYRSKENPARWKGHLEHIRPSDNGVEEKHLAALPYKQVPAIMAKLGDDVRSRAVKFCILTASRRGSVLSATWSEVEGNMWNVPAAHMKGGKAHFVPLTAAMLKILGKRGAPDAPLFPGADGQAVSDAFTALVPGYTLHGCRSSFRDWAREHDFPNDIAEMCLAHSVGTKVEKAYKRSALIAKRRALMSAWSEFACAQVSP
jgi:integrase